MIRRSSPPRRRSPLASGGPIKRHTSVKKVNVKRKAANFARCYHSVERVEFVKATPCAFCVLRGLVRIPRESDNAHTERDGMGRKAGYATIAPLCRRHHTDYDERVAPFDRPSVRLVVEIFARQMEAKWIAHSVKLSVSETSNSR